MDKIRVLFADDSPEFLKVATRLLATDPEIDLVGVASTGQDALALATGSRPNLLLLDLIMPQMNGLEATRRVKSMPNAPIVIILTGHDTPEYRNAATDAGADGFVCKAELFNDLLPLVHRLTAIAVGKKP